MRTSALTRSLVRRRAFSSAAPSVAVKADVPPGASDEETGSALEGYMTPQGIVERLDEHIIGQSGAKRAVAIAMRNRWRRQFLPDDIRGEVMPKNILMVGPTGSGKTEIARRVSKIAQSPFIKVEATKFTEVGFHGKDVDSMIKDLVEAAIRLTKKQHEEQLKEKADRAAEDRILNILTGPHPSSTQDSFRSLLRDGALDERTIEVKQPTQKKKMKVKDARPLIVKQEMEKLMQNVDVKKAAIAAVEQSGIVFIDEIDKICNTGGKGRGVEASSEGVQRDLLPIVEGSTVSTKHGNVKTDYILFIAAGAFSESRPTDLLSELQGRLPIKVELQGLTEVEIHRILTETSGSPIKQQVELLKSEGIELVFEDDAIREIGRVTHLANERLQNLGARRLHTVMELVMKDYSYEAPDMEPGSQILITKEVVQDKAGSLLTSMDLAKYIL